jgi:acylglycerol lipase
MINENRFFRLRDGLKLQAQIKESGAPYWLVHIHGLGEHLGRHQYLPHLFGQHFNLFQFDLRGHGKSEGRRAYVRQFENYIDDLAEVLTYIKTVFKSERIILMGHSMGALIAAGYLQNKASSHIYPEAVFLSAPPVVGGGLLGKGLHLCPKLTKSLLKIPGGFYLKGLLPLNKLSHDSMIYEEYVSDELNSLSIHLHLGLSLIDYANEVFSRPLKAKCPLFCAYGTGDKLVSPTAIKEYFTTLGKEARLFTVQDGYHELHHEIAKYRKPYFDFLRQTFQDTFFPTDAPLSKEQDMSVI